MAKFEDLCDRLSESSVIATLICLPDMLNFSDTLDGKDFTDDFNGVLYETVKILFNEGIQQIDALNLETVIRNNKKLLDKLGGNVNIEVLKDVVLNAKFIARGTSEEYLMLVNNITKMAYRRSLYKDLQTAQSKILQSNDITTLQREVSDSIDKTAEQYITGGEVEELGVKIDEIYNKIIAKQDGMNSGYKFLTIPDLNKYTHMEKNELLVFLAPMKSGKSIFLMNTAYDCIKQGAKVLMLDTEMTDELFSLRLLSYLTSITFQKIKYGNLNDDEKKLVEKAKNKITEIPLSHKYIPNYTMDSLYGVVKTMNKKKGYDTLFFDYIKPKEGLDAYGTYAELGNLTNILKNQIAGDLNMTVVSACQASKRGEIADSVRIGQYASTVIKLRKKTMDEQMEDGPGCGNYRFTAILNRLGEQDSEGETWTDADFFGNVCQFAGCKQHNADAIFEV